jgi:hypothetical protein
VHAICGRIFCRLPEAADSCHRVPSGTTTELLSRIAICHVVFHRHQLSCAAFFTSHSQYANRFSGGIYCVQFTCCWRLHRSLCRHRPFHTRTLIQMAVRSRGIPRVLQQSRLPSGCCRSQGQSGLWMTTVDGSTVLIGADQERRPSRDMRWHICLSEDIHHNTVVQCVFEPPSANRHRNRDEAAG